MFRKLLIFVVGLPLFMFSTESFAKQGRAPSQKQHGHEMHHEQHHKEGAKMHEHAAQEKKEHHNKKTAEKREAKIAEQNKRKLEALETWKAKKVEKCGTDKACLDRTEKTYTKRKEQIEKQHEASLKALEEFKKKNENIESDNAAAEPKDADTTKTPAVEEPTKKQDEPKNP